MPYGSTNRRFRFGSGSFVNEENTVTDLEYPNTGAGFVARARKAFTAGITGAATGGVGTAIAGALADGAIDGGEVWAIVSVAVAGFVVGFASVYAVPNAK